MSVLRQPPLCDGIGIPMEEFPNLSTQICVNTVLNYDMESLLSECQYLKLCNGFCRINGIIRAYWCISG